MCRLQFLRVRMATLVSGWVRNLESYRSSQENLVGLRVKEVRIQRNMNRDSTFWHHAGINTMSKTYSPQVGDSRKILIGAEGSGHQYGLVQEITGVSMA